MQKMLTCDICKFESDNEDDVLSYGEWMKKQSITVHYFCLLLSTELPQRGSDSGGILGFLIQDIQKEIRAAKKRVCCFCSKAHANIACATCRKFFHLSCGRETPGCTFSFVGDFASYCNECAPLDEFKRQLVQQPPRNVHCSICLLKIDVVLLIRTVYCDGCRKAFAHRTCMQRFALSSGYYLRCIWCRKAEFRDWIRLQGIFVPDREAIWEIEKNAYSDLHRGHMRCDIDPCICPKGRHYNKSGWNIVRCKLCASFGVHPQCVGNTKKDLKDYKCPTCVSIEKKHKNLNKTPDRIGEDFESSFYIVKQKISSKSPISEGNVSDEASLSSASIVTVIENSNNIKKVMNREMTVGLPCEEEQSNCKNKAKVVYDTDVKESGELALNELEQPKDDVIIAEKAIIPRPLQLKTSYRYQDMPNHIFLEVYDMNETQTVCNGTIILRFDVTDPRLQDQSQATLEHLAVTEKDVYETNSDRGIYAKLDQMDKE